MRAFALCFDAGGGSLFIVYMKYWKLVIFLELLVLDSWKWKVEIKLKRIKKCHLFNSHGSLVPERAYSILDFSVGSTLAWYLCHINSHSLIPPNLMAVWYTMSRIWGEIVRLERKSTLTNKFIIRCISFLALHWRRAHHVTCNNYLQIMVCSCVIVTTLFCVKNTRSPESNLILKQTIEKYLDLSVCRKSIICQRRRLRQIIYWHVTDKARYFARRRSFNNYLFFTLTAKYGKLLHGSEKNYKFFNTRDLFPL